MPDLTPKPDRSLQVGFWFLLLTCLTFCGASLSLVACLLVGVSLPQAVAWGILAFVALMVGGGGALLVDSILLERHRRALAETQQLRQEAAAGQDAILRLAGRAEEQRRLRHDLRGALSPAMLTADRLVTNADPAVRRAGEFMIKSVDRAASLLADRWGEPSPPAGP